MDLTWMAWTWPTASFFAFILLCLVGMVVWEMRAPGGAPRRGILGLDTTRGDAWLGIMGTPLWGALALALLFAFAVFRWV
jgi:predicted small integral membrane protein